MRSRKVKIWVAVLALVVLLAAGTGAVHAYLKVTTRSQNQFASAPSPKPSVDLVTEETGQTRTATASVTVPDVGYPVYLRMAVVVNWIKDGEICSPPDDATYTVRLESGWKTDGTFYYYNSAISVTPDETIVIPAVVVEYDALDGYDIQVQTICQTIQAVGSTDEGEPRSAIYDAWGVTEEWLTSNS